MAVLEVSDHEFEDKLKENRNLVVKYYASWCGSCRLFAPKFRRMSEEEGFKHVVFLDIDAENNPMARKMAKVETLPHFAVFKDGELLDAGSTSKEESVRTMLEKLHSDEN
ncbi:MAG: thioredoxin family protein [Bacteroidia bacterium]